jgi:uncharacterized protein (DUF1778 family)
MSKFNELKSAAISMRINPDQRTLLDMAAHLQKCDRSSFILDAACRRAEEVILEHRNLLMIPAVVFDAFEQALHEMPFGDPQCLKKLLNRPNRWDSPPPKS